MKKYLDQSIKFLNELPETLFRRMSSYRYAHLPSSRKARETAQFPGLEAIDTVYVQAVQSMLVAGDHMASLSRSLVSPVTTFSPWTLGRGVLESASTAGWLLSPDINAKDRISRSMNIRLEELKSQQRIKNTTELIPEIDGSKIDERIEKLVQQASAMEITEKLDKGGRLMGFDQGLPSATSLCELVFEESTTYRLLSASAHGRIWANLQLGLRRIEGEKKVVQDLSVENALFISNSAIAWLAKPIWNYFLLNGWDLRWLARTLESTYDQVGLSHRGRFWRKNQFF